MFKGLPQPISPAGSSTPWISGTPFFVEVLKDLAKDLEGYLVPAIEQGLTVARRELAANVAAHPEWAKYADQVGVDWDGNSFQFYFKGTPEEVAAMQNLEYGYDVGQPAMSVTRVTALGMEAELSKVMTEALSEEVGLA